MFPGFFLLLSVDIVLSSSAKFWYGHDPRAIAKLQERNDWVETAGRETGRITTYVPQPVHRTEHRSHEHITEEQAVHADLKETVQPRQGWLETLTIRPATYMNPAAIEQPDETGSMYESFFNMATPGIAQVTVTHTATRSKPPRTMRTTSVSPVFETFYKNKSLHIAYNRENDIILATEYVTTTPAPSTTPLQIKPVYYNFRAPVFDRYLDIRTTTPIPNPYAIPTPPSQLNDLQASLDQLMARHGAGYNNGAYSFRKRIIQTYLEQPRGETPNYDGIQPNSQQGVYFRLPTLRPRKTYLTRKAVYSQTTPIPSLATTQYRYHDETTKAVPVTLQNLVTESPPVSGSPRDIQYSRTLWQIFPVYNPPSRDLLWQLSHIFSPTAQPRPTKRPQENISPMSFFKSLFQPKYG